MDIDNLVCTVWPDGCTIQTPTSCNGLTLHLHEPILGDKFVSKLNSL